MLAEFAQLAMARARAASARAEGVEVAGGDPHLHLIAFDRMGRAMRLALGLRRRFADEAQRQTIQRIQARKARLAAALGPAIRLHAPFAERQGLEWSLAHRLETEADVLADLPFAVGLERLRLILGLPQSLDSDPRELSEAGEPSPVFSFEQEHKAAPAPATWPISAARRQAPPETAAATLIPTAPVAVPHAATGPP